MKKRKGFTLVELVIVIAVIAVLAAVLIPTFSSVMDKADDSADLQLLRNMNTILTTNVYSDETATAENLRHYLRQNGIDNWETKNKDNIIVYNQEANRFEKINIKKAKFVLEPEPSPVVAGISRSVAKAEEPDTYTILRDPYSFEEIIDGYTIIGTTGNEFVEAIYALHNPSVLIGKKYNSNQTIATTSDAIQWAMRMIEHCNLRGTTNITYHNIKYSYGNQYTDKATDITQEVPISQAITYVFDEMIGYMSDGTYTNHTSSIGKVAFVAITGDFPALQQYQLRKHDDVIYRNEAYSKPYYMDGATYKQMYMGSTTYCTNPIASQKLLTSVDKVIIPEDLTRLDISIFNNVGIVAVLPDTVTEVYSSKEELKLSNVLFSGNTEVLVDFANEELSKPENKDKTQSDVLGGAQVSSMPIWDIKKAVKEGGALLAESEFYLVNKGNANEKAPHYYTDLNTALEAVSKAAKYSGKRRELVIADDVTINSDITIPNNVTLQIPFYYNETSKTYSTGRGYGTAGTGNNTTTFHAEKSLVDDELKGNDNYKITTDYKKFSLTVPDGKKITVEKGGQIIVGGVSSCDTGENAYQGHVSGNYGQITNNGDIILKDGASLETYGYIKESGTVTAEKGSTVLEPLITTDFKDIMNSGLLYAQGAAPFYGYSVLNIQSALKIKYGAALKICIALRLGSSTIYTENVLIGYNGRPEEEGLIVIDEEGGEIDLGYTYNKDNAIYDDSADSNLKGDIGRTTFTIPTGTVAHTGSIRIYNAINTGSALFPISYNFKYDIQGTFNVYNRFVVLPGAKVTVASGGNLNIKQGTKFYVADYMYQDESWFNKTYPTAEQLTTAGLSESGVLTVNGTMTVESGATVGGIVRSSQAGGKLIINEGATVNGKFSLGGDQVKGYEYAEYTCPLRICVGSNITAATAGKTYVSEGTEQIPVNNVSVTISYSRVYNAETDSEREAEQITKPKIGAEGFDSGNISTGSPYDWDDRTYIMDKKTDITISVSTLAFKAQS